MHYFAGKNTGDSSRDGEHPSSLPSLMKATCGSKSVSTEELKSDEISNKSSGWETSGSSSLESNKSANGKGRKKVASARIGTTSDWLSSLPTEMTRRAGSLDRRITTPGEKMLLGGEAKGKFHGKCASSVDAKWPSSIMDESQSPPDCGIKEIDESGNFPVVVVYFLLLGGETISM